MLQDRLKFSALALASVGALAAASWTGAHHSSAGFESEEVIELTGTIHEFQFRNPHSWIQVLVPGQSGEPTEWSIEWGSPNSLFRQGYNQNTFPAGEEVMIRLHPAVSGDPIGGFVGARFNDGTTIGDWDDE